MKRRHYTYTGFFLAVLILLSCQHNCSPLPDFLSREFTISEDAEVGAYVGDLSVVTEDCILEYSISSGTYADAFSLDPFSGVLSVARSGILDYETAITDDLEILVCNKDFEKTLNVRLTLEDVADTRLLHAVFDSITITKGVVFGNNPDIHTMDVYEPYNDLAEKRPVVLLVPGGAFQSNLIVFSQVLYIPLAERLAKAGYVAAILNYTTLTPPQDNDFEKIKAFIYALYDLKAAVRYCYKDADLDNKYSLDTDKIFLVGYSAGADISLHHTIVNSVDELTGREKELMDMFEGFEGPSGNEGYQSQVAGMVSMAGVMYDHYRIAAGDPAIMTICGTKDLLINAHETNYGTAYGSREIFDRAEEVGLSCRELEVEGQGHHMVTEDVYPGLWDEIRQFIYPNIK